VSASTSPGAPWIGRPLRRAEDARFLDGSARYVGDLKRPGMLHGVVLRSDHAHARVRSIDARTALALPGVVAVYTFEDIRRLARPIPLRLGPCPGLERFLQLPLAEGKVRYVGEPLAFLVAEGRYVAEDALELVQVEYEALDPVVDVHAARADRSLLHEALGTNVGSHYTVEKGDVSAAFAGADYTRRETFRCHRQTAAPMETRGLLAEFDAAGRRLRLWGATKVPFYNRRWLAGALDLPEAGVELIEVDVGGSFGVRGELYPEDFLVPFAAMRLGRPVKWIEDRREHFVATNHSREIECELEIACTLDGEIIGLRGRLLADMGAYVRTNGGLVPAKAAQFLPGPYRIPNVGCEVFALLTNKTPVGTYRGPGFYESSFFRERLFDLATADLRLDPAEFRRRNLVTAGEMPYGIENLCPFDADAAYDSGDFVLAFERALAEFDYARVKTLNGTLQDGRLQGVGLGCFVESGGAGPAETARLKVAAGGRIELYTGCSTMGQGHETAMAQIGADSLGLPVEAFSVFHGSTTLVEQGYGTYNSRAMAMGGSAVKLAAENLIAQLLAHVARMHEIEPAALEYSRGAIVRREDHRTLATLAGIAAAAQAGDGQARAAIECSGTFNQTRRTYSYGTNIAHVAVDPETARVEVLRFLAVDDVGRAINPLLVHGQMLGAAVQGIGGTFLDELIYDEQGQLLTGSFADYLLPTATEFPNVEVISLEAVPSTLNPLGVRGAGEGGIIATGAALANAVAHALAPLGVKITELPLSPNKLAQKMREARAAAAQ